jgi:hypothetical protein
MNFIVCIHFSQIVSSSSEPSIQSETALQKAYCGKHCPLLHRCALRSHGIPWRRKRYEN